MVYNIENQLSSGHGRRKKNQFPKRRDFILYFNILSGRWTKSRRQLVLNWTRCLSAWKIRRFVPSSMRASILNTIQLPCLQGTTNSIPLKLPNLCECNFERVEDNLMVGTSVTECLKSFVIYRVFLLSFPRAQQLYRIYRAYTKEWCGFNSVQY